MRRNRGLGNHCQLLIATRHRTNPSELKHLTLTCLAYSQQLRHTEGSRKKWVAVWASMLHR